MSYRLLVLPNNQAMPLSGLKKIAALVDSGAIVAGSRPTSIAGLVADPGEQRVFDELVARLWSGNPHGNHVVNLPVDDVLHLLYLVPDFRIEGVSDNGEIDWIHRRTGHTEIFLVTSRWDSPEHISAQFRVQGMQPELWDPVTGQIRDAVAFHQHDGVTTVPLSFSPRGSVFVVFRQPIRQGTVEKSGSNEPVIQPFQQIDGPWQVRFDPQWGGLGLVTFPLLVDWTKRPEGGIRLYSGTADYSTSFTLRRLPSKGDSLFLNLGEVHEEAVVRVNGVDLGVVWTKPARINITKAVRPGINTLQIEVVNLWPNRLIGDEALPPAKRFTLTNAHKFGASTPLLPSGLLGPLILETQRQR